MDAELCSLLDDGSRFSLVLKLFFGEQGLGFALRIDVSFV
jgi:hypothetical protein